MLNTHKLLYILPDVTYVAELLPAKKEHTFAIQAFRQINGEFINDEEEFIAGNVEKLFSKLEPEHYRLILPDFLFTNTIIEVQETNEGKVKQYIKEELLQKLGLSKETHEIAAFILTQYGSVTKIQLTALEKEVLDAVVVSANAHSVTIDHISPLTWTLKSVISLEPSISVVQIGSMLYTSEHYIGVDQCTLSKVEEIENVGETIKTLKGAQPSIQTVYLLTNSLVEEKLKDLVSNTLPIQQLTSSKEGDEQMPSYVRQIVESGMKTLDIPDFSVPSFALPKSPVGKVTPSTATQTEASEEPSMNKVDPKSETKVDEPLKPPVAAAAAGAASTGTLLAKPQALSVFADESDATDKTADAPLLNPEDDSVSDTPKLDTVSDLDEELPAPTQPPQVTPVTATTLTKPEVAEEKAPDTTVPSQTPNPVSLAEAPEPKDESSGPKDSGVPAWVTPTAAPLAAQPVVAAATATPVAPKIPITKFEDDDATIAQFASNSHDNLKAVSDEPVTATPTPMTDTVPEKQPLLTKADMVAGSRPVIKNPAGGSSFMKMAFVTLVVFALTVAIGVGVGFGLLSWSNRNSNTQATATPSPVSSPVAVTSPKPSAVASASATPKPASASASTKADTSILVVNATTKAGYAGATTSKLKAAGYKEVTARNAKGEYEAGMYVLLPTEDASLVSSLGTDSGLDLEYATGKATEDPTNQYDAVIVLAE